MNYNVYMAIILVTGATGFVGRRLMPMLVKKYGSHNILCLVRDEQSDFESEGRRVLDSLGVKYIPINLESYDKSITGLNTISTIIHMAANTNTADLNQEINIKGTVNLLRIIKNISPKCHIIYTSSAAIFAGRKDCRSPLRNNSSGFPTNMYGRKKYLSEEYLLNMQKLIGFKLTIIRPTTIYGSHPRPDSMFEFINRSLINRSLLIRLNWPGKTGLVSVDDAARAVFNSINRSEKLEFFNLASESPSFGQIVDAVAKAKDIVISKIALPHFFWTVCSLFRPVIFVLENFLPLNIYNLLWRSTLIVDDVIYCKKKDLNDLGIRKIDTLETELPKIIESLK